MNTGPFVLATRSADKVRELTALFAKSGQSVVTLDELGVAPTAEEEWVEDADSFEGNALAKGRYFSSRLNRAVVADDSGLEVQALGGRPGVLSKRWSGRTDLGGKALDEANNSLLVAEMFGIQDRRARYVCVAAFCETRIGVARTFRGITEGMILEQPRGEGGFGYDPFFFSVELRKTFGEATLEEKQRVSHRARAFRALLAEMDGRG